VVADDADEAEQARFWRLAREPGLLDALVAAAEARAAEAPRDVDAHMDLADAYVARLLGTPGGPEQGLWGAKAERAWQAVIEIDPEHWQARYDLALSWSYYPDMMNRTGDAIRAFERLREQQERGPPEARHADVYLHLYQLHLRRGERERAQAVLQAGLARHPDDAALVEAAR
jgi:tetratricopeptide (TPR) repeat protein